jgi:uncharacterized protein (DUF433 family)
MTTVPALSSIDHLIWQHPDYRGGRPCIAGTGISVAGLAEWWKDGLTVEEIAEEKSIPLEQVCAAIAYYLHNQTVFDAELARDNAEINRLGREHHRQFGFPE